MSHKSGVWKFFTGSSRAHCTLCTSCSRGKERGSTEYKYSLILVTSTGKKEVPNWCVCFSNHCNMHGKFHELKTLVKQACRPMLLCRWKTSRAPSWCPRFCVWSCLEPEWSQMPCVAIDRYHRWGYQHDFVVHKENFVHPAGRPSSPHTERGNPEPMTEGRHSELRKQQTTTSVLCCVR